ncbi:MAG: helix-turn-helix transcriptional regulator [Bacteroidales bacterium]|nr:helix-turn-helix transcriptional regulator [Bacteroidales bacterium]MDD3989640.1 helix-turn-helix transcriptional regulator [Bacteroidales bacterium]
MKKNIINRLKEKIKPVNRIFVSKNLAISTQISHILEQKGWSQKDLAKEMHKEPSEVSKLMSGLHNITLMSIANIESALGEDIITTPLEATEKYNKTKYIYLKVSANTNYDNVCTKPIEKASYKSASQKTVA